MQDIHRRDFIKGVAVAAAGEALIPPRVFGEEPAKTTTLYVVHGKNVSAMLQAGIEKMGGWKTFVQAGKKATIKPNSAWASRPEQGGNTDPALVGACVAACLANGAKEVVVPENPCSPSKHSFKLSGIEEAVKKAGGSMYDPGQKNNYRKVSLPQAVKLKEAEIVEDVLDTGCLINMPVAKSHSSGILTLSMKNWMGSVKDRQFWHQNDLHQCIADFSTFIKPALVIIDATRIMVTNGPRGPGKLEYPDQIILGTDPVACDAYAATLFGKKPLDLPQIRIAQEMKVGVADLERVNVVHIHV